MKHIDKNTEPVAFAAWKNQNSNSWSDFACPQSPKYCCRYIGTHYNI